MAWVSPRTWTTSETLTATKMNEISSSLHALGDAWTAYTPTWNAVTTSPSLGNGSIAGLYLQPGKTVFYRISLTIGSSTTMGSGGFTFSLPATISAVTTAHSPVGIGTLFDSSATTVYVRTACILSTTTIVLRDDSGTAASATVPATWATGDRIVIQGAYEAL